MPSERQRLLAPRRISTDTRPRFRLDHAYGMATRPQQTGSAAEGSPVHTLHHSAGMFDNACFYLTHGQRIHNGLVTVSYALTGADAASFNIDGATGAVTFKAVPDYETKSSYAVALFSSACNAGAGGAASCFESPDVIASARPRRASARISAR